MVKSTLLVNDKASTRTKGSIVPTTAFSSPYHATPAGVSTFIYEAKKQIIGPSWEAESPEKSAQSTKSI